MAGAMNRGLRQWLLLFSTVLAITAAATVPANAQTDDPANAGLPEADRAALQARSDVLFQQMLENPADLDTMFAFAEVATALGNFDQAISTLERMLMFNPDLPRVRLELGLLYLRVGAPEVARMYFTQATEGEDVPEPVRERVAAYLEEIDRLQSRHWFEGSVFAGLRYQTNANAGPGSSEVLAGGEEAFLDDEFVEEDDFNAFLSGVLLHRYDLDTKDGDFWESRAIGYGAKQFDLSDLDLAVIEGETGPWLTIVPGTRLRPFGLANAALLGDELLFTTLGGGFEVEHVFGGATLGYARYTARHKDFRNSSDHPTADEQTGLENEIRLGLRYRVASDLLVGTDVWFLDDHARTGYHSNEEVGATVALQHVYPAPFDLTSEPWMVSLSASGVFAYYDEPDPLVDPDRERRDKEYRITLSNSFRLDEDLSIEAQIQRTENDSRLPNFDRENWSFLLGALWTY